MDQETDDGLTPVIIACQNGNAEQLKELLENGVCCDIWKNLDLNFAMNSRKKVGLGIGTVHGLIMDSPQNSF